MSTKHGQRRCVIGIDVGGTKIKLGAVEFDALARPTLLVDSTQIPTPRADPAAFYDAIASAVREMSRRLGGSDGTVLPVCAVAHPGRFLPDGTLARGTTPNLGAAPGRFDGMRPADELQRRLGGVVVAENDAVAQMRFGLHLLLNDPAVQPALLGETVVYLGPGTGMGGGVARVDAQGGVAVITDGHLFDMHVPWKPDELLTAEELFTGPAITRLVVEANRRLASPIMPATSEQISRLLVDPHAEPAQRAEAERIADLQGDILACLIETIHAGRIVKVRVEQTPDGRVRRHVDEPDRRWPAKDQEAVRGARRFLLGGSVGTDEVKGGRIRQRALEALSRRGLADVTITQVPSQSAEAGVMGAVMGIPPEALGLTRSAAFSRIPPQEVRHGE